jgi:hypothetical protein
VVAGPVQPERELTNAVNMCQPNGRLNQQAVGWSRQPIHGVNLQGWGRNKRFEYWCITTPEIVVALNISHGDYRVTLASFFYDRASGLAVPEAEIHWLPSSERASMPAQSGRDNAIGKGDSMQIEMLINATGTRLLGKTSRLNVDIQVQEASGHESLSVLVPWDDKRFQYTRKDNCLPATGFVELDGKRYAVDSQSAYATLDHGRGRWPYSIVWNWASGSGRCDGHELGLQFGGKWTEGTPSTENALKIDGRLHKISQELDWQYDRRDFMKPWTISGDQVDLTFTPEYDRYSNFDRLIVRSKEHQCFGTFAGTVIDSDGKPYRVADIYGWAEEVARRW